MVRILYLRLAYFKSRHRHKSTRNKEEIVMGINAESDVEASLQIGPTEKGMVRLYVSNSSVEIPMDFEPDEAQEIAEEILSAAKVAAELVDTKRN